MEGNIFFFGDWKKNTQLRSENNKSESNGNEEGKSAHLSQNFVQIVFAKNT